MIGTYILYHYFSLQQPTTSQTRLVINRSRSMELLRRLTTQDLCLRIKDKTEVLRY